MVVLYLAGLATLVALLLVYCVYGYGRAQYRVFRTIGVPGPPPLPLFGNYLTFLKKEELKVYEEWRETYGPVCGFYVGKWPWLLVSDHDMLQHIFVSDFTSFSDRIEAPLLNSEMAGLPLGIFETCAHKWQPLRRLISPLFTNMKLKKMTPYLEESCEMLLKRMSTVSKSGHSVDVQLLYEQFVLETATLVILGQRVNVLCGEGGEFVQAVHAATKLSQGNFPLGEMILHLPTQFFLGSTVPGVISMVRWFGPGRLLQHFQVVQETIMNLICNHKNDKQDCSLLDALMSAYGNGPNSLTQDEIISHCFNTFTAACDTTSITLTCCSHVLATHTHIQDKLCTLLDQYWQSNPDASISAVAQNIPYLDMFIDETLRMFPPSPRIVRVCSQSTTVNGLEIPKGTCIVIPILLLHTRDEVWDDPHVFRPERFETQERLSRPPCSFLPFGQGPRNCIGMKVARLQVKMALVALLRHHRFITTSDTHQPLEMDCTTMTSYVKFRVLVGLQSRLYSL